MAISFGMIASSNIFVGVELIVTGLKFLAMLGSRVVFLSIGMIIPLSNIFGIIVSDKIIEYNSDK